MLIGTPEYMSPEQAEMTGAERRHADRRLFARGHPLRAPGRGPALRSQGAAAGRLRRDPAEDPGGRSAQAEHQAEHDGRGLDDAGPEPADGAAGAHPADPGRPRLDHDEGAGEGPDAALRLALRPGGRHRPVPAQSADRRPAAEHGLQGQEVRPPSPVRGRGGLGRRGAPGRVLGHDGRPGPPHRPRTGPGQPGSRGLAAGFGFPDRAVQGLRSQRSPGQQHHGPGDPRQGR